MLKYMLGQIHLLNQNMEKVWLTLQKFPADLVIFTKEILNEKLHFLCSVCT